MNSQCPESLVSLHTEGIANSYFDKVPSLPLCDQQVLTVSFRRSCRWPASMPTILSDTLLRHGSSPPSAFDLRSAPQTGFSSLDCGAIISTHICSLEPSREVMIPVSLSNKNSSCSASAFRPDGRREGKEMSILAGERRGVRHWPRLLALGGRGSNAPVRGSTQGRHQRRRLRRSLPSRLRWGPRTLWMEASSWQPSKIPVKFI